MECDPNDPQLPFNEPHPDVGTSPNPPDGTLTSDDPFSGETNGIPNGLGIPSLGLPGILGIPSALSVIFDATNGGAGGVATWWTTFLSTLFSWQNIKAAQQVAVHKGWYSCIGNEMFPFKGLIAAGAAKAGEEAIAETVGSNASSIAGAYYHLTDGRFTAWGEYSRVLVPRAAGTIEAGPKLAKIGGWIITDAELAHAEYTCRGRAQ
jgi:hypothetical protein